VPAPLPRRRIGRYTAPAAFLLAVTIAVLLIRSGLGSHTTATTTQPAVTHPAATTTVSSPPRTNTTPLPTAQSYTVQRGDTFGSIAAKVGTTIAALETLNPGVSSTALQVGEKIRVK
jgi:LysM repeat protein